MGDAVTTYLAWLYAPNNGMSSRLNNALIAAYNGIGIDTFAKLRAAPDYALLRLRNFGKVTLRELRGLLSSTEEFKMAEDATPSPEAATPVMWTADEAAAWLRTPRGAVYCRAERGTLPGARKDGRRLLIVRDELIASVLRGARPRAES